MCELVNELFVLFFSTKIVGIFIIFEEHECFHVFVSLLLYNSIGVLANIHSLAFGSCLYIRYNTAAHIVNSTKATLAVHTLTAKYDLIVMP